MRDGADAVVASGTTARLVFQGGGEKVEVVLDCDEAEEVFDPLHGGFLFAFPPSSSSSSSCFGVGVELLFFRRGCKCR